MMDQELLIVEAYLRRLLLGMIFRGYTFRMFFILEFYGEFNVDEEVADLPGEIMISLGDWWFGNRNDWSLRSQDEGVGIQPDEPLLAFELTRLVWNGGNRIVDLFVSRTMVSLIFEDGTTIHSVMPKEGGVFIRINEMGGNSNLWFEADDYNIYFPGRRP